MLRVLVYTVLFAVVAAPELAAEGTPGVVDVAPGVHQIDGAKVPGIGVDASALEALLKQTTSYSAVRDFLHGEGIISAGPANTTAHMYKAHDTVSGKNLVLILFVKDGVIVDHLLM